MDRLTLLAIIIWSVAFIFWMFLFHFHIVPEAYKSGQVDALSGNIKYELVTHPDSTKTWEEIE